MMFNVKSFFDKSSRSSTTKNAVMKSLEIIKWKIINSVFLTCNSYRHCHRLEYL